VELTTPGGRFFPTPTADPPRSPMGCWSYPSLAPWPQPSRTNLIIGQKHTVASTVRNLAGFGKSPNIGKRDCEPVEYVGFGRIAPKTISSLTLNGGSVTTGTGHPNPGRQCYPRLPQSPPPASAGLLSLGGVTRTISVGSGSASPDLFDFRPISPRAVPAPASPRLGVGQMTLSGSNKLHRGADG